MDIKDIRLKKGMGKKEVNELISRWLELVDDIYMGNKCRHNWKCHCGEIIKDRTWDSIRSQGSTRCKDCSKNYNNRKKVINIINNDNQNINIKNVKLIKGMTRDEVNKLIGIYIELIDNVYMGNNYNHRWNCECGEIIESRTWATIKGKGALKCQKCKYENLKIRHKLEVDKIDGYEYINSYFSGDILPNGKIVKNRDTFIMVKHKYCGNEYIINTNNFINQGQRCSKCCGSYENSFANHIEQELGESLDKYWDFEKNTVNPYHISKNMNGTNSKGDNLKVWIKCQEKDYHGSYEIACNYFVQNKRCSYCASKKIHPKDSFAQYHIDNTDKDFLEKYWDYEKNTVDPFTISTNTHNKVWIKCQERDYHKSYPVSCSHFTNGKRCGYCNPAASNQKVHLYDSFGYNSPYLSQSWSINNNISPFGVANNSGKKYKFICPECGIEFKRIVTDVSRRRSTLCIECSTSQGEKKVLEWLKINNIYYIPQKEFSGLIGLRGGNLSYDFYLPEYNLLIEYQGEFHDGTANMQKKEQFKQQQEHDRRKREYAKNNNIGLLEIWYWNFDTVEEILEKELNK